MKEDEFYIGWMPKAPRNYARHVLKVVAGLAGLVIVAGFVLSFQQKKFSTSSFEFGQLTSIRGVYHNFPVPSIKCQTDADPFGHSSYLTIPLVGYGKFGAEGAISLLEKEQHGSLEGKEIVIKGTLLYSDGKTLLQIDVNDRPLISVKPVLAATSIQQRDLGIVHLNGEIIDPKCYFGVMKPGSGKPHRDCAIRCIEGGMSPVFYVRNEKGEANYYLIVDRDGKKINSKLKDYIADPVELEARAVAYDDWIILYVDGMDKIKRTGGLSWFKTRDPGIVCGPGMK